MGTVSTSARSAQGRAIPPHLRLLASLSANSRRKTSSSCLPVGRVRGASGGGPGERVGALLQRALGDRVELGPHHHLDARVVVPLLGRLAYGARQGRVGGRVVDVSSPPLLGRLAHLEEAVAVRHRRGGRVVGAHLRARGETPRALGRVSRAGDGCAAGTSMAVVWACAVGVSWRGGAGGRVARDARRARWQPGGAPGCGEGSRKRGCAEQEAEEAPRQQRA